MLINKAWTINYPFWDVSKISLLFVTDLDIYANGSLKEYNTVHKNVTIKKL